MKYLLQLIEAMDEKKVGTFAKMFMMNGQYHIVSHVSSPIKHSDLNEG